jgi:hypothetical protein
MVLRTGALALAVTSATSLSYHVPFDMTWQGGASTEWNTCAQWGNSAGACPLPCSAVTVGVDTTLTTTTDEHVDDIFLDLGSELFIGDASEITIGDHDTTTCCDSLPSHLGYEVDAPNSQCKVNTAYPTAYPTASPTTAPTAYPTAYPTASPTKAPTAACVPGTFGMGGDYCEGCPAGKYTQSDNMRACDSCVPGQFAEPTEYTVLDTTGVGNFRGCTVCPSGKFQGSPSKTDCDDCSVGYTGDNATNASLTHDEQCTKCASGKFQHMAGATTCFNCPSGKFSTHNFNGVNYPAHGACLSCTVYSQTDATADFTLREYWTQDYAGWDKCEKHALDCAMPAFPAAYDTCTKTCRNTVTATVGNQDRYVSPTYHAWGEMNHATLALRPKLCQDTGLVATAADQNHVVWQADQDRWQQRKTCEEHWCPIDCLISVWGKWDQCTKTCGQGEATRKRTVVREPKYGGKACPSLSGTEYCNPHACTNGACHTEHVKCTVSFHAYGASTCVGVGCNQCDDALECNAKNLMRTISVVHNKKYQSLEGKFHCHVEDTDKIITYNKHTIPMGRKECVCRCNKHPVACHFKDMVLQNSYLKGNILQGIDNIGACSNLCSHHPECGSWQYDGTKTCTLMAGEPVYADNTNALVTTWAGAASGQNGCTVDTLICSAGQRRVKNTQSEEHHHTCVDCAAGYTSHRENADHCVLQDASDCPAGKHAYAYGNLTFCHDLANQTNSLAHYEAATNAPTLQPTSFPTGVPTVAECITECPHAGTDQGFTVSHSILATCLACKAHMPLADFCAAYPSIDGC